MKVRIRVTEKHIDAGKPRKCNTCPIALAITDQTKATDVNVGVDNVLISAGGSYAKVELPEKAENFIADFDEEKAVKPFSFALDLPEEFLK
jgi:hypothetical protein